MYGMNGVVDNSRKSARPDMSGIVVEKNKRMQRDTVKVCNTKKAHRLHKASQTELMDTMLKNDQP